MQAPDREIYIASALCQGPDPVTQFHLRGLSCEDVTDPELQEVVRIAEDLTADQEHAGPGAVRQRLRDVGIWHDLGGQEWWSGFVGVGAGLDLLDLHASEMARRTALREAAQPLGRMVKAAKDPTDSRKALETIKDETATLLEAQVNHQADVYAAEDMAHALIDEMDADEPADLFLPMGFPSLDSRIDGLHIGRLNVLAARTGHGKSLVADQILLNCARRWKREAERSGTAPKRAIKFDMENSLRELRIRLASNLSGVKAQRIKRHMQHKARLDDDAWREIARAAGTLSELPILFDMASGVDDTYIRSRVQAEAARGPVGLVIVDYLTQMGGSGDPMERVMDAVVGLHNLARDMGVPVLAVSQINRKPVQGSDPAPKLHHMAWSSDVEQKPAMVMALHHDHSHWEATDRAPETEPDPHHATLYVRKNKGPQGAETLHYDTPRLRVTDPTDRAPHNVPAESSGAAVPF